MWKKDNVAFINDQFKVSGFLGLCVSSKKNRKSFWNLLLSLVHGRPYFGKVWLKDVMKRQISFSDLICLAWFIKAAKSKLR